VRRPGLIVGVLGLAVIAYITYNSLTTEGPGSRGVERGSELPAFAVPLALSDLEGNPNLTERACEVRGEDVLNVCELAEDAPVVLAFFAEPIGRCVDQIDVLDRLRSRYPDVRFAAVAIRGGRDDLRRRVRERGWRLPVGHDENGAVANAYAVAVCPQITFAARGGEVQDTTFGSQDEQQLTARLEAL
jgi:thiol-disulfide isomerase/thioredoxin